MPLRLGYAILFVSDLDRSVAFYRDAIGLHLRFRAEEYAEFEGEDKCSPPQVRTGSTKFALFPRSALPKLIGREAPGGRVPWPQGEVAFLCDDVDAAHERLRDAGVEVLMPPTDRPWGERTLHLADPDGNVVELTQRTGEG